MTPDEAPDVREAADIAATDGRVATVYGRYTARAAPVRGAHRKRQADRATVVLADGTAIWLEPLTWPESVRPAEERHRLDGRPVRARGRLHARMPARGESLVAPCLARVSLLEPES